MVARLIPSGWYSDQPLRATLIDFDRRLCALDSHRPSLHKAAGGWFTGSPLIGVLLELEKRLVAVGGSPGVLPILTDGQSLAAYVVDFNTRLTAQDSSYIAKAVHFDGSTVFSATIAPAASPRLTWGFWFRIADPGVPNVNYNPFGFNIHSEPTATSTSYMNISSYNGDLGERSVGNDNGNNTDYDQESCYDTPVDVYEYGTWYWCSSFIDVSDANPANHVNRMCLNDTVFTFLQNSCGDFSSGAFNILFAGLMKIGFISEAIDTPFTGDVADLWIAPGQFIDFSVTENRRKFISASNKPVNLGVNGATPTGTAPVIFFSGDASSFGQPNLGSGGAFSHTGSLTDASTSPSD